MSEREGTLRLQPSGRWAVCRLGRDPIEINSGELFRVEVDGEVRVTRMEQLWAEGYYSIDAPDAQAANNWRVLPVAVIAARRVVHRHRRRRTHRLHDREARPVVSVPGRASITDRPIRYETPVGLAPRVGWTIGCAARCTPSTADKLLRSAPAIGAIGATPAAIPLKLYTFENTTTCNWM